MSKSTIVIGIAGGTNSGKTTFVRKIEEEFGQRIAVLSHDFYYKSHDDLNLEERGKINYDHPSAFDTDLLVSHVIALKNGDSIYHPVYDFAVHNRTHELVQVKPSRVILVEGILIFQNQQLRDLCDIKLFIDTPSDIRLLRRIKRDIYKRGRTVESVINQYTATVRPMHELYVEPTKQYADIIVPEGGKNVIALEMVNRKIRSMLDEE